MHREWLIVVSFYNRKNDLNKTAFIWMSMPSYNPTFCHSILNPISFLVTFRWANVMDNFVAHHYYIYTYIYKYIVMHHTISRITAPINIFLTSDLSHFHSPLAVTLRWHTNPKFHNIVMPDRRLKVRQIVEDGCRICS